MQVTAAAQHHGTTLAPGAAPEDEAGLCFDAPVPGWLVHRRTGEQVLLTDWRAVGGNGFRCAARLPAAEGFERPASGRYSSLLLAECVRQAGILVAHAGYDVSPNVHFVMRGLRINLAGDLTRSDSPCDLVLDAVVHDLARSGPRVRGFVIDVAFRRRGELVASGSGSVSFAPPAVYTRLRWGSDLPRAPGPAAYAAPVDAESVGEQHLRNVVLGDPGAPRPWPLRVPADHPILSGHALDHVPGMLVLEAIQQAGRARLQWSRAHLTRVDARFMHYLELDEQATLSTHVTHRHGDVAGLIVRVQQMGRTAAQASAIIRQAWRPW